MLRTPGVMSHCRFRLCEPLTTYLFISCDIINTFFTSTKNNPGKPFKERIQQWMCQVQARTNCIQQAWKSSLYSYGGPLASIFPWCGWGNFIYICPYRTKDMTFICFSYLFTCKPHFYFSGSGGLTTLGAFWFFKEGLSTFRSFLFNTIMFVLRPCTSVVSFVWKQKD